MKSGDLIVLIDAYRQIYTAQYHIGLVLCEDELDPYYKTRRLIIVWANAEIGHYAESIINNAWLVLYVNGEIKT